MAGNTKILVFKLKELIYTGIFILLGILLIILFICMFNDSEKKKSTKKYDTASSGEVSGPVTKETQEASENKTKGIYKNGKYTSSLVLNNGTVDMEIIVENGKISSVSVVNMDPDVESMYPLIKSAVNDLSAQLVESQSFENITYAADCKYTYLIIIDAVRAVLELDE